jgi:hypothetical protein
MKTIEEIRDRDGYKAVLSPENARDVVEDLLQRYKNIEDENNAIIGDVASILTLLSLGNILIVNPLSSSASNSYTRTEALGKIDKPFQTILGAATVAFNNDVILVTPATYTGNMTIVNNNNLNIVLLPGVTITGNITYTPSLAVTANNLLRIIGLSEPACVINGTITNGENNNVIRTTHLMLNNLTVNSGNNTAIESILAFNQLTLSNVTLNGNTATLINRNTNEAINPLLAENCTFVNTTGGLLTQGGGDFTANNTRISNSKINLTGVMFLGVRLSGVFDNIKGTCSRIVNLTGAGTVFTSGVTFINNTIGCTSTSTAINLNPVTTGGTLFLLGNIFVTASSGNTDAIVAGVFSRYYNNFSTKTFTTPTAGANNQVDANLTINNI